MTIRLTALSLILVFERVSKESISVCLAVAGFGFSEASGVR